MRKTIIEWSLSILTAVVLVFVIKTFLFDTYRVDGSSMNETFHDGDRVIVNKFMNYFSDYSNGDVIVFNATEEDLHIKRIIGKPGDKVHVADQEIFINGELYDEPYIDYPFGARVNEFLVSDLNGEVIPDGHYIVLGDNRTNSRDSRHYGLVDRESIIGEVQVKVWPFSDFTINFK